MSGKLFFKKAQKHAILITNILKIFLDVNAMEIEDKLLSSKSQTQLKEKVIQCKSFNCQTSRKLSRKTDNITVGRFNLYHKFHET